MTDDSPVSRRRVLRTVGIGTAVALAGCLGGGNGSDDGDSSSTESTPNDDGGGNGPEQNDTGGSEEPETNPNDTGTTQNSTNGNKGGQEPTDETDLSGLLEEGDDERYIGDPSYRGTTEKNQEEFLSNENIDELTTDYWIEFHNPDQQIPVDDGVIDEYPALRVFEELIYPDPSTTYMIWGEGENGKTQLAAVQVGQNSGGDEEYAVDTKGTWMNRTDSNSKYPEEADVQGILEDVVRSVSDVPKELETEYGDILREKQD